MLTQQALGFVRPFIELSNEPHLVGAHLHAVHGIATLSAIGQSGHCRIRFKLNPEHNRARLDLILPVSLIDALLLFPECIQELTITRNSYKVPALRLKGEGLWGVFPNLHLLFPYFEGTRTRPRITPPEVPPNVKPHTLIAARAALSAIEGQQVLIQPKAFHERLGHAIAKTCLLSTGWEEQEQAALDFYKGLCGYYVCAMPAYTPPPAPPPPPAPLRTRKGWSEERRLKIEAYIKSQGLRVRNPL